jgi:hypothetical protein
LPARRLASRRAACVFSMLLRSGEPQDRQHHKDRRHDAGHVCIAGREPNACKHRVAPSFAPPRAVAAVGDMPRVCSNTCWNLHSGQSATVVDAFYMDLRIASLTSPSCRSGWKRPRRNDRSRAAISEKPDAPNLKTAALVAFERVKLARFTRWLNAKETHFAVAVGATHQRIQARI